MLWSAEMNIDFTCGQNTYNKIKVSGTSDITNEIKYYGANQGTQDVVAYEFKTDITFNQ